MKRNFILSLFLPLVFAFAPTVSAQSVSQKDYCYKFFTTPRSYDISSVYADGQKEYMEKGESTLTIEEGKIILKDDTESLTFPMDKEMSAITVKKGKDPLYAFGIDFSSFFSEKEKLPKGLIYITVAVEKKKKIVTIFAFHNGKKANIMKMELF